MSALERLLAAVLLVLCLLVAGWFGVRHYGAEQYEAGQAAAVAAGEKLRQAEADRHHETETNLRAQLHAQDINAHEKEQTYAANLEAAQRRVRAGTDRLRCPASPIQPAAAPDDRPAAAGPVADPEGPDIVPETAAAILGDAADVAGLVRRYERVVERFEDCRAVNAR